MARGRQGLIPSTNTVNVTSNDELASTIVELFPTMDLLRTRRNAQSAVRDTHSSASTLGTVLGNFRSLKVQVDARVRETRQSEFANGNALLRGPTPTVLQTSRK